MEVRLFRQHDFTGKDVIRNIVLTALCPEDGKIDYESLSTDVIVELDDGEKYIATFYSSRCLESLIREERLTPEYSSGHYYRLLNMVLVRDFNEGDILPVIEEMIAEGDFQVIFNKV